MYDYGCKNETAVGHRRDHLQLYYVYIPYVHSQTRHFYYNTG